MLIETVYSIETILYKWIIIEFVIINYYKINGRWWHQSPKNEIKYIKKLNTILWLE